jgi:hypothetical protein
MRFFLLALHHFHHLAHLIKLFHQLIYLLNLVPEPFAILAFLLTSIKAAYFLSIGVMEWIIASMCLKHRLQSRHLHGL